MSDFPEERAVHALNRTVKTGTTTVGIMVKDAVILGADKRATMGYLVASKTAEKIQKISEHIAGTIAGGVADAQYLMDYLATRVRLYEMRHGKRMAVNTLVKILARELFSAKYPIPYHVQHIIGGVDGDGPKLYDVGGDGSILKEEYASTGSGSVFAYGVLEDGFKPGMDVEAGIDLVRKAVGAAISRDIASGNGIDVVIITRDRFERQYFDPA